MGEMVKSSDPPGSHGLLGGTSRTNDVARAESWQLKIPLGRWKICYFQGRALDMQHQHYGLKAGGRDLLAPWNSHGLGHVHWVMLINILKVSLSTTV